MKKFRSAIILSFVTGFMFFIFEPITMYANNVNDFWFDFRTLIKPTFLFFLICSVALFLFFLAVYYVAKKLKRPAIYDYVLLFSSFCFLCAYIHSNFLTGFLPVLNGDTIDWNNLTANIVSIIVCLVLIAIIVIGRIKLGLKKVSRYLSYVTVAIFAMLSVSLLSTCLTTPVFEQKGVVTLSTNKNLNTLSTERNFIVFLVDAVDSRGFNEVVQNSESYKNTLKDFSYFPDTTSGYAFTRDSIPFIFSGVWNENKESFFDYSTRAFNESTFLNALEDNNWQKELYDMELVWRDKKALNFDNIVSIDGAVNMIELAKQEIKYAMLKSLPFPLKRFSKVDTIHFETTMDKAGNDPFTWYNQKLYANINGTQAETTSNNLFKYIHIEGGHVPFDMDEDLNTLPNEDGTYLDKLRATMKVFASYIDYLKANDAYDNATIVLLADHGFEYNGSSRQNPILYIKGPNEQHENTVISDKQVSYADLCQAFFELLGGANSTEVFSELPAEGRTRRFLYNGYRHENHIVEYEQSGKAWDESTLKVTGRSFDL